jgi:hypothetical protein
LGARQFLFTGHDDSRYFCVPPKATGIAFTTAPAVTVEEFDKLAR